MSLFKKVKDVFEVTAESTADIVSSIFLEGVVGTFAPGVTSVMLAYKQKRQEKMFELFMKATKERSQLLENRLSCLEEPAFKEFKDKYFGLVSDYVLEEVQEEKIKYITTGFINIAALSKVNEDFVLTYYDTLRELRIRDLGVLKFYYDLTTGATDRTFREVLEELNIEYEQYEAIRIKLERWGLLTTKRDKKEDDLYENMTNIQEYLDNLSKGRKANLKRLKRIEKKDSYLISKFGREFIEFFAKEEI